MGEFQKDSGENRENFKPVSDALFTYLRDVIYDPAGASLDMEILPEEFNNVAKGLQCFAGMVFETRALARELSKGNLDCPLPAPGNEIAAPLKMLHASLKHLTWQTQQVAKGDYGQRVNFMGDFSEAFNHMIGQLEERHKISIGEKTRLEMYVQLILANCPNPILLFDNSETLTYVSYSYFKYSRISDENRVLGISFRDLMAPYISTKALDEMSSLYRRAITEKCFMETVQEMNFYNPEPPRHFEVQIIPMLNAEGTSNGVMVFLLDMTESVRARQEAERARELAEQSSLAKSRFLAKMSHEIRTPMNAIMGMAELALREEIPPAAAEHIRTIKQAGANLLSIINDILDFSKIETGKLEIVSENYLFSSLVYDVINIIKTRVFESRLRFVVNLDGDIPNALCGDSIRIRQILLNLLSNAVKYTEEGFVAFSVKGEMAGNDTVIFTIEVSDSGRGIKDEEQGKLFGEFERLDMEQNKNIEGTGLGLAIAWNLIRAMNGRIHLRSEYGRGSTFTVTLPQKVRDPRPAAVVENPGQKRVLVFERREIYADSLARTLKALGVQYKLVSGASEFYSEMVSGKYPFIFIASALYETVKKMYPLSGSGAKFVLVTEFGEVITDRNVSILSMPVFSIPIANCLNGVSDTFAKGFSKENFVRFIAPGAKILIVDDIATNLQVAEGLLLPYQMQVRLCQSGIEAIEAVKAERYDLVLMDHMMPVMDGIETVLRIRSLGAEDPYFKTVPVIALTANAVSGAREMFLVNGFDDFLSKPIDTVQMDVILQKWIPREKLRKDLTPEFSGERSAAGDEGGLEIEGIDTKTGIAMCGGTLKNYLKILAVFRDDGIRKTGEIMTSLEAGDIPLYVTYAHALKSASANIGALGISEAARTLEQAGRQGNTEFIKVNTPRLLEELTLLIEHIKRALTPGEPGQDHAPDTKRLKDELTNLKAALNAMDSGGIAKSANALEDFSRAAETGTAVRAILENKLIGEYDRTVSLIDDLLQSLDSQVS